MRSAATPLLLACLTGLTATGRAAEISVDVTRTGEVLHVTAAAEVEGTVDRAWQVLTDYGRLAEIVPDLQSSRVISREGNRVVVEQKGEARLLFFSFPLDIRLAITEYPTEWIVSRAIAGNFQEMQGTYRLEAREGRVSLRYSGRMVPGFDVPPLIGTLVLRRNVERTFRALVEAIERGHAEPAPRVKSEP
jgi:hypothetical protein